ncbi:alanyl-tRNA editing protein [Crenobacter sp. SG2303]|uniref:Alanyl-tRNA editing protein n=1 Tax=Crenobacter oryzisoli TaxID=3056844 RepID=A0ABT7XTV7_9NEIS|nr:alanyl-tRNA editing protein [Crenobacter sp. SG2303]MDN0077236.1 alanyl-tRNA editing protein [Crenobacter sp. SG2303]
MTRKIFWQDPYRTAHKTRVSAVDKEHVCLEETIFFAFSGGQESDSGTLAGVSVLAAEKNGSDIVYTLPPDHGLQVGCEVEILIDWERRYRLMRLHFAAEMVLQLVYQLHPGIERIGAHIAADKARIDFAYAESIAVLFPQIEARVETLLTAGLPIVTAFSDEVVERRYWEVEGFARMACGGTHPRSTSEIGALKLKRKNIGKGKERIEITLVRM